MNFKTKLALVALSFLITSVSTAQQVAVKSPDGHLQIKVNVAKALTYSVAYDAKELLSASAIGMDFGKWTTNQKLKKHNVKLVSQEINPVIPLKFSTIKTSYNLLKLDFAGDYSVEFRAYNEGIAYRFVTSKKDSLEVTSELAEINFPADYSAVLQQPSGFKTAYEEAYKNVELKNWKASDRMSNLPILVDSKDKFKLLFSEADLQDYPALFLKGTGQNGVVATFPKYPLSFGEDGDRSFKILKEATYIAKTSGSRAFPWRFFVVAKNDGELITNTMVARLADKSALTDVSWIKPGQVSWEWWNGASPYGPDVNFEAGYNMDTYKYIIDFAAKSGLKYIIMDEGWAKDTRNPFEPNPTIDLKALIAYGKQKNVDIVLWLTWLTVENNFDLFKTFSEWGIKGVKIDFMDRSDQWMVRYYERVAKEAAKYKMFVDFHGAFKPAGLEYKYPNIISYEGVRGLEQMGGATPNNNLYLPFMRNAVGPMDYTPGAMINMQPQFYVSERPNSASMGTRVAQMALFVVFESGLQMLADNPTMYYKNQECTDFITSVPTTWDETKALAAEAGKYVLVAKRKGDKWFIGGISNSDEVREFDVKLDFLKGSQSFKMVNFEDGINANYQAMDYRRKETEVKAGQTVHIKMAKSGGWAAVIGQ